MWGKKKKDDQNKIPPQSDLGLLLNLHSLCWAGLGALTEASPLHGFKALVAL